MEEISKTIQVTRLLKQVMDAMRQNVELHFKEMGLTGPQGMLVGTLAHCGEMKVSDLSEKLGLSNSTVSGIVDRLEKQDLVERVRSEEDRRVVYVCLSDKFRRDVHGHYKEIERGFEEMMSKATTEELDAVIDGLGTLKTIMERQNI
jgi:DNA-binding MarR family transcriptional regulator